MISMNFMKLINLKKKNPKINDYFNIYLSFVLILFQYLKVILPFSNKKYIKKDCKNVKI